MLTTLSVLCQVSFSKFISVREKLVEIISYTNAIIPLTQSG